MYKYTLICVGRLKEDYYKEIAAEYEKRLGAFCKLEITELGAAKLSAEPSEREISNALLKEGADIIARIPKNAYTIALCIEGRNISSEEFAKTLSCIERGEICFVIGGSYGLADSVKARADFKMSMSKMTFPHRLARVMLTEQIYRSFMIDRKYHK